ncbi:MAG TPA: hypothetical protein QF564_18350 [Pirellulaceae bacterium]|nr:hypothetical protein [Pirellulaceae bacterium]
MGSPTSRSRVILTVMEQQQQPGVRLGVGHDFRYNRHRAIDDRSCAWFLSSSRAPAL